MVNASSSSVYGSTGPLPRTEQQAPDPIRPTPSPSSRPSGSARASVASTGWKPSLRYFNVFGPRQDPDSQYAAVVPRFIRRVAEGQPITVYGDGEQSRDFTYVDNVVDGQPARRRSRRRRRGVAEHRDRHLRDDQPRDRHDRRDDRAAGRTDVHRPTCARPSRISARPVAPSGTSRACHSPTACVVRSTASCRRDRRRRSRSRDSAGWAQRLERLARDLPTPSAT